MHTYKCKIFNFRKLDSYCSALDCLVLQKKYKTKAKLCGMKKPRPYKTLSNSVRITFLADESGQEKGFKIKWEAVTEEKGFFT